MDPPAVVVDYDPGWPTLFEALFGGIRPALAGVEAYIEHVGSTAVPGLAGKPIIDMDVVVPTTRDITPAIKRLVAAGTPIKETSASPAGKRLPLRQRLRTTISTSSSRGARRCTTTSIFGTTCAVARTRLDATPPLVEELLKRARSATTK